MSNEINRNKAIEFGCGRGNMSLYFWNDNCDVLGLDVVKENYYSFMGNFDSMKNKYGRTYNFDYMDLTKDIPQHQEFYKESADVIYSIGLLEHLTRKEKVACLKNTVDMLKPGGWFFHYVVPEKRSIQTVFNIVNNVLSIFKTECKPKKSDMYRDNDTPFVYKFLLAFKELDILEHYYCMPYPLISHSPEYPFSPLPGPFEKIVTLAYRAVARIRKFIGLHPWKCGKTLAQGFVVYGRKKY